MKSVGLNVAAASVFLLATFNAYAAEDAEQATQNDAAVKIPSIIVTTAEPRKLTRRVIASGSVVAAEEIYVQPLVSGQPIETINVDAGDTVKAGDVLATLSTDTLILQKSQLEANLAKVMAARAQLEAQLVEVEANTNEALRQRDRIVTLAETGTVSSAQADQANASATAASARLNSTKEALKANDADIKVVKSQIDNIDLNLARTEIKAPAGGLVAARNANVGAIAAAGAVPLFTIIKDGEIELKADLSEVDILKIEPGQKVSITVAGARDPITGSVRNVDPTVNSVTRLGTVHISLDDTSRARVGMYASAEIVAEEKDTLALPVTAVSSGDNGSFVRRVKDGVVEVRSVVTGIQDGDYIEVVDGVGEGDEIVAKAGAFVRDGDQVEPVHQEANLSN